MKVDCDYKNVMIFFEKLIDKASESGWKSGRGDALIMPDSDGVNVNLLTEYGMLADQEIRNHVLTCIVNPIRRSQNNVQIQIYLEKSLTE